MVLFPSLRVRRPSGRSARSGRLLPKLRVFYHGVFSLSMAKVHRMWAIAPGTQTPFFTTHTPKPQ